MYASVFAPQKYELSGKALLEKKSARYLGVWLDSELSGKAHLESMRRQISLQSKQQGGDRKVVQALELPSRNGGASYSPRAREQSKRLYTTCGVVPGPNTQQGISIEPTLDKIYPLRRYQVDYTKG